MNKRLVLPTRAAALWSGTLWLLINILPFLSSLFSDAATTFRDHLAHGPWSFLQFLIVGFWHFCFNPWPSTARVNEDITQNIRRQYGFFLYLQPFSALLIWYNFHSQLLNHQHYPTNHLSYCLDATYSIILVKLIILAVIAAVLIISLGIF